MKHGAQGELKSFKICLVACRYVQIVGIDFDEAYSLVVELTSLRILFAIATQLKVRIHQMDIVTSFLNSSITTEIYVKPPEAYSLKPNINCFRLVKALYVLKQSPRE